MRNLSSHFGLALVGLGITGLSCQAQLSLSGTLSYADRQTGEVWVAASLNTNTLFGNTRLSVSVSQPFTSAPFTVSNLFAGGNYQIFAWRDSIPNGVPDPTEAQAWHPDGTFLVTSNRTVAGFTLTDPDNNSNGLPDWWEVKHGLTNRMGSGRSGSLLIHPGQTNFTDSVWASVLGSNPAGTTTLNVARTNGFASNDLVMIITMQDPNQNLALNKAGTYEMGRIASLTQSGGVTNLVLAQARTNVFNATASEKIQVLKVPEYTEVNLSGSALKFFGTNFVRITNLGWVIPTNEITVEFWARIETNAYDWPSVFTTLPSQNTNRLALSLGTSWSGGNLLWDFGNGWGNGRVNYDSSLGVGTWQHLALVASQSGPYMRVFRNGVLEKDADHFDTFERGDYAFELGNSFVGQLHEFRIWNKARSQAEIQGDMNHALSGSERDLVAYYRLDEGGGTNVLDATGHGLNGAWVNAPAWVTPGSLTCQPWNGTNGGVLAFTAYQVTLGRNSVISADGKGYRGGPNYAQKDVDGYQGESFGGFWPLHSITNNLGGGGGGGRSYYCAANPGGGGGYAVPGRIGGLSAGSGSTCEDRPTTLVPAFGGNSYGSSTLDRLFMGSGGGSGGQDGNDGTPDGLANGGVGGAGGGILVCSAGLIRNNGQIGSSGQEGSSLVANERGTGGGGAGGSVWITANWQSAGGVVQAQGGAGGKNGGCVGGNGGVGRIRLDLPPGAVAPILDPPAGFVQHLPAAPVLWSPYGDTDQDGLSDWVEYQLDTNPVNPDTDGDTLPDGWEVAYAWPTNTLNPGVFSGAMIDSDRDDVPDLIEFQRGTRPDLADTDGDGLSDYQEMFVYRTDPLKQDTDGDGISDAAEVTAGTDPLLLGTQYFYDPLDRLVGVQHENGLALGYEYDRNNNLVRQFYADRDANGNGLPDLWEFLQGLTDNPSGFVDTDGDGWSDYQEWQAGTNPRDAGSVPNLLGNAGTDLASLTLPFTPSNFVVGVGQFDGLGAEEIVIGADGNPGTTTNFLLVLSQTVDGWSTQRVYVGSFGVTSIAVGQPANRPSPAIYVGLRQPGGTGSVVEFRPVGGVWTPNTITNSTSEAAFVLGVRAGENLLVSLAPSGTPYYLSFAGSSWTLTLAESSTSQRGLGTVTTPGLHGLPTRGVRLLNAGGIQVLGDESLVPADAIWNGDYLRWFFLTPSAMTWDDAQAYARLMDGNLATVPNSTLNLWLWNQFKSAGNFWIGLSRLNCSSPWMWASSTPFDYKNWRSGEPNCGSGTERMVGMYAADATWNDFTPTVTLRGVIETLAAGPSLSAAEPPASQRLLCKGHSLCDGDLRLTSGVSILYTYVDDKNLDGVMNSGDEFVMAEYLFSGSEVSSADLQHIPLSGSSLAQSYGLASVDVLYGNQQVFFTAEPDGRLFSWSATNATAPLQRQLFSAQYAGKAWHALAGVRTLAAGESLLGLRVDSGAPNRCDLILWPPQRELWSPTTVPQTAPITQILTSNGLGRDIARLDLCIWDAEGGAAKPELEFQRANDSVWSNATIVVSGAAQGWVASSPIGMTNQVYWDAARDLGPGFTNTVKLRARAEDNTLMGEWSPPVMYAVQNSLTTRLWATNDVATTPRNTPVNIDVLANDNAVAKFIAFLGAPAHGTAVTNLNQTVRYTPMIDFVGTDQFTYTMTDGAGGSSMATVTVTVTSGSAAAIVLASPALQSSTQFSMTITGPAGIYRVQASTNLTSWAGVRTLTNITGVVSFTEAAPANTPARFYRVRLQLE